MRSHRALRALAVSVTVLLGVAGRFLPAPAERAAIRIDKVRAASYEPRPDGVVFVLVVGNDYRPGVDGKRADAIHLVGVNPKQGRGTMLNIPRDTWVAIPGWGMNKINAANTFGGPDLMARTIRSLTGIMPDFVVMTDFGGFTSMVDELHGVRVPVPFPMDDANSGARFPARRVKMSGAEALAFSRNRHIPGGDFRRSQHQGLVILSALAELRHDGRTPADTLHYLGVLYRHAEVQGVTPRELYALGRLALSLDPRRVRNVVLPGGIGQAGGQSIVTVAPTAQGLFADLRDDGVLQRH